MKALLQSVKRNSTIRDERQGRFDDKGDLENILFELEVKHMKGQNSNS